MELESFGFEVLIETKTKKQSTPINSAFIKADTLIHLMFISADLKTHPNARLKIKIEVDRNPPTGFKIETKYHLTPIPFTIKTMSLPSFFAGKLHAALCRDRIFNIKGRDWYDLVWFVKKRIPVNLHYLKEKMLQSGHLDPKQNFDHSYLLELLNQKAKIIDFKVAIQDVAPFLKIKSELESVNLWSADFFKNAIITNIVSIGDE